MIPKICILLLFVVNYANTFFHEIDKTEILNDKNTTLIENIKIIIPKCNSSFPDTFNVKFDHNGRLIDKQFQRVYTQNTNDIYVIHKSTHQPVKLNVLPEEKGEIYRLVDGEGFARLIENNHTENPFRLIATINSDEEPNVVIDIFPTIVVKKRKRSLSTFPKTFDNNKNYHSIRRRALIEPIFFDDSKIIEKKVELRLKRAVNGQPIVMNVELLIVADLSVIQNFQRLTGTTNPNTVFSVMRHYYSHLINGVNQRYQLSMANDPDLRINIILTNFLFLDNPVDQQWLSVQNSGDSVFRTYNGRDTLITDKALTSFANFMVSKTFNFEFDHAALLFNKELLSNDVSQQISTRAGTAGYSPGLMCTQGKYSINEDFGGFSNLLTIAHEIGHNLGASHDDNSCSISQKYIMASSTSGGNLNRFSICSINQFKTLLLNPSLTAASSNGQCLLNSPSSKPIESQLVENKLPGEFLSPDDQCKMMYGPTATFCTINWQSLCQSLNCRKNSTETDCIAYTGAADGTLCDSGKLCEAGNCVSKSNARTGTCLYGDGVVTKEITGISLTSPQMKCTDFFGLITTAGQSISGFCSDTLFGDTCCQSCKKYNALRCKDTYWNCPNEANNCLTKRVFINGVFQLIRDVCQRTCSSCTQSPLICEQAPNICQNGGTCTNTNVGQTELFGFRCNCPTGYSGELCETKLNSCLSSPCRNGGTCQSFGSLGYVCICSSGCGGYDCSECSNISPSLTSTSTSTPAPTTQPISVQSFTSTRNQLTTDFNSELCSQYRAQNLCDKNAYVNGILVKDACPVSCKIQVTTETTTTVTIRTTTSPANSLLTDYNDFICKFYSSNGFCELAGFLNGIPIKQACAKSCNGYEITTTRVNCLDTYPDLCGAWASYCFLLNGMTDHPCKRTCSRC